MVKYSEEEKKSIEYLKEHINYFKDQMKFIEATDCDYYDEEYEIYKNRIKQFETILNILEKQQKEIERLKRENKEIKENCNDIYVLYLKAKGRLREFLSEDELNSMECIGKYTSKNYIPKEEIRELTIKLDNDIKNTKSKLQEDKIKYDDIRKARLKAFITKMNEFKEYLKGLLGE